MKSLTQFIKESNTTLYPEVEFNRVHPKVKYALDPIMQAFGVKVDQLTIYDNGSDDYSDVSVYFVRKVKLSKELLQFCIRYLAFVSISSKWELETVDQVYKGANVLERFVRIFSKSNHGLEDKELKSLVDKLDKYLSNI